MVGLDDATEPICTEYQHFHIPCKASLVDDNRQKLTRAHKAGLDAQIPNAEPARAAVSARTSFIPLQLFYAGRRPPRRRRLRPAKLHNAKQKNGKHCRCYHTDISRHTTPPVANKDILRLGEMNVGTQRQQS